MLTLDVYNIEQHLDSNRGYPLRVLGLRDLVRMERGRMVGQRSVQMHNVLQQLEQTQHHNSPGKSKQKTKTFTTFINVQT